MSSINVKACGPRQPTFFFIRDVQSRPLHSRATGRRTDFSNNTCSIVADISTKQLLRCQILVFSLRQFYKELVYQQNKNLEPSAAHVVDGLRLCKDAEQPRNPDRSPVVPPSLLLRPHLPANSKVWTFKSRVNQKPVKRVRPGFGLSRYKIGPNSKFKFEFKKLKFPKNS